jgi:uroporphyrin-III C-methyltransferase
MQQQGKVILLGAGPGDPELLTLKGVRHLQQADVVLTDRLVNPAIVEHYAPQAVVIPVGKQCRQHKSTPQATINELMVHHAQAGRYVVRLKGGDTAVFSNMADELEALRQAGITYEIVPGITAASGAAAAAGITLTARHKARGIRLLTYYNTEAISAQDWAQIGTTDDTLVFYMSAETASELAGRLIAAGQPGDTPIMVAAQVCTPAQQFFTGTLVQAAGQWAGLAFPTPALLIVGKVVDLFDPSYPAPASVLAEEVFPQLPDTSGQWTDSSGPVILTKEVSRLEGVIAQITEMPPCVGMTSVGSGRIGAYPADAPSCLKAVNQSTPLTHQLND